MLRRIINLAIALSVATASGSAFAHPGHGVIPPEEPAHWLEPVHFVPVLLVGLGLAAFAWRRSRRDV